MWFKSASWIFNKVDFLCQRVNFLATWHVHSYKNSTCWRVVKSQTVKSSHGERWSTDQQQTKITEFLTVKVCVIHSVIWLCCRQVHRCSWRLTQISVTRPVDSSVSWLFMSATWHVSEMSTKWDEKVTKGPQHRQSEVVSWVTKILWGLSWWSSLRWRLCNVGGVRSRTRRRRYSTGIGWRLLYTGFDIFWAYNDKIKLPVSFN